MSEKDKESRVFYITHSGEVLIWLFVIFLFVAWSSVSYIIKEKQNVNDYHVFLQDVDGLIVGSPVRMMGVEVGHVTKIKPTPNEVYVKFILTAPDVYVPQGTVVTVEFSGMAGSKSLELYLPDKDTYIDNSVPLMTVNPPKRLHDALALLSDMYKKLGTIIYGCSSFGKKLDLDIEKSDMPKANLNEFLDYSNKYLDDMTEKTKEFKKSLKGLTKHEQ